MLITLFYGGLGFQPHKVGVHKRHTSFIVRIQEFLPSAALLTVHASLI